jgi:PAS domain S-box-containing protein
VGPERASQHPAQAAWCALGLRLRRIRRAAAWALVLVVGLAAASPTAFGARSRAEEERPRIGFFLVTVLIASTVAGWLYVQARRIDERTRNRPEVRLGAGAMPAEDALVPAILREAQALGGSTRQRQQFAQTLSQAVTHHVQERVRSVRQELSQKYEHVIEEKTRAEAAVRERYQGLLGEKQHTESVLRSVAEGLVVVDDQGRVVFMNPAAERLLAVTKEEKLGHPLQEGMKDEQLVSLVKGSPGGEQEIELSANLDNTKRVLRATNAVIEDEDGRTVGMVSVLSDITKQRELERLKLGFLSKISHELRTPIVAIRHSLGLLLDHTVGPLTGEQEEFLSLAHRNLDRLNRSIDELLNLGKLETGKVELRRQTVSIEQVIAGARRALEAWAMAKALTLETHLEPTLPPVSLDPDRITQVLQNLIGNAIKFTPANGRITVTARVREAKELEVNITDTGPGIAKADLPKLFQKFQQVGERAPADVSGTGLGLAIAKEIVELHGGRIWADSEPARGTTFTFTLPLGPTEATGLSA